MTRKQRKRYAQAVTVCFDVNARGKMEAPQIGAGVRRVVVERIGPKWVKVRAPATGRSATFTRGDWDRIVAAAQKRGLMT